MKLVPAKIPSGNVLIYEYGVRLDKSSLEAALDQILKARRLYNNIIAEIRETVELMRVDILRRAGSSAEMLQARVDFLTGELNAARVHKDDTRRERAATERREVWKELAAQLKKVRTACRADHQERFFSRIGKKATCATYQLRCQAVTDGLGWATANVVLDNALLAFKKSFVIGNAPRFAVAEEKSQDTLTLQFTAAGGVSVESLLAGQNNDLLIRATNGCGPRKYGELQFRLGRAIDNQFATGTWQYHRPLPADASIGRARLVRRKIGKDYRWYLQLQVKTPEPIALVSGNRKPLAAIHFGWASDINGCRVAGLADSPDPSAAQIIQLPMTIEQALRRSASLQSQRDRLRDLLIPQINAELTADNELIEEELASIRQLPPHYVSLSRLHRVCRLLSANTVLPVWLEEWRKVDRQLWQAAAHGARRARNQRRDFYRKFALDVAKNYSTVVIEPLDLVDASQKMEECAGERSAASKKARAGRVIAAIYELELAMHWACTKTGAAVLELSDATTTSTCAICGAGSLSADPKSPQLLHCLSCGAHVDRKQNGAALAYQLVAPLREEAAEEFFIQAAEIRRTQESVRTAKQQKIQNARLPKKYAVDALAIQQNESTSDFGIEIAKTADAFID